MSENASADNFTIPRWFLAIAGLVLTCLALVLPFLSVVSVGTFAWVWNTHSEMARMKAEVVNQGAELGRMTALVKETRDEQLRRASQPNELADLKSAIISNTRLIQDTAAKQQADQDRRIDKVEAADRELWTAVTHLQAAVAARSRPSASPQE